MSFAAANAHTQWLPSANFPGENGEVLSCPRIFEAKNSKTMPTKGCIQYLEDGDVTRFMKRIVESKTLPENFFVVNLTTIKRLYLNWRRFLPRIEPFYAVKCNPDPTLIQLLNELGASFDCASKQELEMVVNQGVSPSKIIFANPCKNPTEIAVARELGVKLTTFDNLYELEKLRHIAPECKALLRIRADDPTARHKLGNKFGATLNEVPKLCEKAKALGVSVVGVSFHIGSGATDPKAFYAAIELARKAFDIGSLHGLNMTILDVGGGFCSGDVDGDMSAFEAMANAVNASLDRYFPADSGVSVIAEPGRYFMETCAVLACYIFGVRDRLDDGISIKDYWITDGIHGSFNPITVRAAVPKTIPLRFRETKTEQYYTSTVFGPTCDGEDFVMQNVKMPELFPGDWLLFLNMGAYMSALSSNFNGMHGKVDVLYVQTDKDIRSQ